MEKLSKLRGFYLFLGLAGGSFGSYLTLLLVHNGLDSGQIGILMATGTLIAITIQPIWGIVSDRYNQTRLVLILSVAIPALLAVFYRSEYFIVLLLVYTLSTIFSSTQAPIADSYAISAAKRAGATYGSIRLMMSIGAAVGAYLGGLYVSSFSVSTIWLPFLMFNLIAVLIALTLPKQAEENHMMRQSFSQGVKKLLGNRVFLAFLGGSFLVNQTMTAFGTYFVIAFQSVGGSTRYAGIALFLASVTNVPSMLFASKVIKKLGRERTLLLGALIYVLRWGIQVAFPYPSVMIGVQVLHGLSFGFFYIAAVEYVSQITSNEMQATGQSVFNMVFSGFAGVVGNLLNGFLLNQGGVEVMNLSCMLSSIAGAMLLFYVARSSRSKLSTTKLSSDGARA
ncbi:MULTISPECIES: MFS transporter [Paenibacillus]|jgi:PPP family 3-phenylpropionic acid transporter|uniref:MFS transporter n=1 Tax=Paenibacillus odorifer TaxID=189426 RepID=A0A1R0Z1T7_9BACL|nr:MULTISPECIES: MFS transporter [Paenibacillus]AIQ73449.1 maltose permease [Paenibacillus odorifer]AWV32793.1 MFS transporter [Paenibacillus odorifer]ETT64853.1 maltose permease [Paenibacillus sp. FSL H8-237]MDH6426275.1 PPP family 3-phenylpropionic acid transporter [Paenibacillus sp. PastH-4]MDH6442298.1 PPP family 3-phenylpropionic acid transporter [Paenibacillus sp. PastF-4]